MAVTMTQLRWLAVRALVVGALLTMPAISPAREDLREKPVSDYCSIVNLIATPERYDGKRVRVEGVATIGFEMNALYLSRDSAEHAVLANGVGLAMEREDVTEELKKAVHLKWVVVDGVFHAPEPGETGWRGHLGDISRLYDPTTSVSD